ncbi:hypothetical protein ACWGS9_27930 [Bradyrhizobium sp. Arg314]
MSLTEITQATVAFIREHEAWDVPLVLVLALGGRWRSFRCCFPRPSSCSASAS